MEEPQRAEPRYKAFLSYSHKDAAAAARIHRRLENYRLPRRLVGRESERGRVPQRLWPIFRDREEMAASTDLSETVRAALERSAALIVLCSPASAGSLWVAEEIATFRALHPTRPVLAAIIAGEPPDCFPEPLRARGPDGAWHEPLATDLRRERDGPHLGLLKLVAGLTGVGLDDLVQRDAHRRIRRVTAVTGIALAAMLIMAALTVVALSARREADRQRAEAEGLIEFMLTELRERLRGVGRLDVLTAVNERALRYYGDQEDLSELDAASLLRRSRILQAMGEDDIARGRMNAALRAFHEAHRVTAEQLAREPHQANRIFAHAQAEYWIGRVHELNGQWAGAKTHFARYASAANRLITLEPSNPEYMLEMAWGSQNLGGIELNGLNDPASAQRRYEEAIRWFTRAAEARRSDAEIQRHLANAYGWLADSFYARSAWRESLAGRLRAHEIYSQLLRVDPSNVENVYRVAIAERSIARLGHHLGQRQRMLEYLDRAYRRSQQLIAHDPANSEWLLLAAKVQCDLIEQATQQERASTDQSLRAGVRRTASALRAQGNPRISEISRCLGGL